MGSFFFSMLPRYSPEQCWKTKIFLVFSWEGEGQKKILRKMANYNPHPANIYLFKINNRNTRKRCKTCSKLTINVLIVNFEHISYLFLVFLLLTLKK